MSAARLQSHRTLRGSVLLSRLSMLYPELFHGFAWIGLGFMEPITSQFDLSAAMELTKALLGYEGYAYWEFFSGENAYQIIEKNVSAFEYFSRCRILLLTRSRSTAFFSFSIQTNQRTG